MESVSIVPASLADRIPLPDEALTARMLAKAREGFDRKIVVLDDDPTGVQTVHGVSVYTDWKPETLRQGFAEQERMFFILTNSRGLTAQQTETAHRQIARAIDAASRDSGRDYILISRSDSTLRGHYPLETAVLRQTLESLGAAPFDGEIIYPFFQEGGRYTLNNIHYVREGDQLIPAGMTEFARDRSFGYTASSLPQWCQEKCQGGCRAEDVTCIALEDLRAMNLEKITRQLLEVGGFGKVIVNSADYADVKVFTVCFLRALRQEKRFLFRSAAAVTKVLGGIADRPLLTRAELVPRENCNGGIVLIGSHVNKTTQQMEELRRCRYPLEFLEFNQHLVLQPGGLEGEVIRVVELAQQMIRQGQSVVIYTRRDRLDLPTADPDRQLEISVQISEAVTSIIGRLEIRPNFIIAKGGITSSDVGIKALRVHRATVMGQLKPGIPVWMTGPESKFPGMPYVIFPGNVGEKETLRQAVELLMGS